MRHLITLVAMAAMVALGVGLPNAGSTPDAEYWCTATVGVPCQVFCGAGQTLDLYVYGSPGMSGSESCADQNTGCIIEFPPPPGTSCHKTSNATTTSGSGWCEVSAGTAVCYVRD